MEELEGLSLVDLRLVAKKMGVKSVTSYRKQELLDLLKEKQKEENAAKVSEEKTADQKESVKGKGRAVGKEKAEKKEAATEKKEAAQERRKMTIREMHTIKR